MADTVNPAFVKTQHLGTSGLAQYSYFTDKKMTHIKILKLFKAFPYYGLETSSWLLAYPSSWEVTVPLGVVIVESLVHSPGIIEHLLCTSTALTMGTVVNRKEQLSALMALKS